MTDTQWGITIILCYIVVGYILWKKNKRLEEDYRRFKIRICDVDDEYKQNDDA